MFVRAKASGDYHYLQLVENHREGKRTVQRVVCTLGRVDKLMSSGATDVLLRSLARFGQQVKVVEGYRQGHLQAGAIRQVGPDLVFGRLWRDLGIGKVLKELLQERRFEFPLERALYLTVLHRLFDPGADRACDRWKRDVYVPGTEVLELHHLYRAMRWLGESKDSVEEALFQRRKDLFTELSLVFFDTTSIYFEGRGGESLGQNGHSKDHRPDLKQMVMGAVLTGDGRPICCEMWPGNHTDVKALLPVVDRLRERFQLKQVCWVADRGMISKNTIEGLEGRQMKYILGARMRRTKEVREVLLKAEGKYQDVGENLKVKEVWIGEKRYIACYNPKEATKDATDREAIIESLREHLKKGAGGLIGNKGYRRYVRVSRGAVSIDEKKIEAEARFDGKFVLRTNSDLPASEVALQYKRLQQVEHFFRSVKSLLETRPVYHHWNATIRGHVFCSFLALVLMHELRERLAAKGCQVEWDHLCQDLEALAEVEVRDGDQWYRLRTALQGVAGKVLQAVGVAIPPPAQPMSNVVPRN